MTTPSSSTNPLDSNTDLTTSSNMASTTDIDTSSSNTPSTQTMGSSETTSSVISAKSSISSPMTTMISYPQATKTSQSIQHETSDNLSTPKSIPTTIISSSSSSKLKTTTIGEFPIKCNCVIEKVSQGSTNSTDIESLVKASV